MKRGGPIQRRTPLKNRPPTKPTSKPRSQPMRRTRSKGKRIPSGFWETRREELYARAGGRCEHGGCSLDQDGMQAHHRRLRSQGGGHGLENLTALCPTHHRWMHDHPAQAMVLGYIVSAALDSAEQPVLLHTGQLVRLTPAGDYATDPAS